MTDISYLVTVFSRSSPGDLRAETIRDAGWELETLNRKLEDSSWTRWELYLEWKISRLHFTISLLALTP